MITCIDIAPVYLCNLKLMTSLFDPLILRLKIEQLPVTDLKCIHSSFEN